MKNFVTDCFCKETNEIHLANLHLGLFEMKNFVTDYFSKENKRKTSC